MRQPLEPKTQFPWEKYLCLRLGSWSKKKNRERQSFITDRRKRVEGGLATTHRRDGAKRFFRPSPSHSPFVPAGARTLKTLLMSSNSLVYCSPESYLLGLWPDKSLVRALKSPGDSVLNDSGADSKLLIQLYGNGSSENDGRCSGLRFGKVNNLKRSHTKQRSMDD